jgi:hydrogenase expression/formation protein HypC
MCLGIPGRIEAVWAENGTMMATADFAGEQRRVCLAYLPDLAEGDYVIVHAGFALTRVAPAEAEETLTVMRQYGIIGDQAGTAEDGAA